MYRKKFIDLYLKNNFPFDEAKSEIDFVLDVLFNYTNKDFCLGKILNNNQTEKALKVFNERVMSKRPIQQIVSCAYFYGRKFFVNENTLIPRPETELLVKEVLDYSKCMKKIKVLDIGTGTGCIPITLVLENSDITAHSVDISDKAIETAKKNALFHNVYEKVKFFKSDLFENVNEKYDIIVSNPPYIPLKDKNSLQSEVRDFDPSVALFSEDDLGVQFYEKIIPNAWDYLLPNGLIAFEFGINQADIIYNILKNNGFKNIKIKKDLNSTDRIISAVK